MRIFSYADDTAMMTYSGQIGVSALYLQRGFQELIDLMRNGILRFNVGKS